MKFLRRTDLWLLLPIAMMIGGGLWLQNRNKHARLPTRIVVREVKHLPLTASDVGREYDTRVRLSLGYEGARPEGWGVEVDATSGIPPVMITRIGIPKAQQTIQKQQKAVSVRDIENRYDKENDVYSAIYLLRLREVPDAAPVTIRGDLTTQRQVPGSMTLLESLKSSNWQITARGKNEKTASLTKVSRYSGLTVKKIDFWDKRNFKSTAINADSWNFHVDVALALAPSIVRDEPTFPRFRLVANDAYFTDKQGSRFTCQAFSPIYRSDKNGKLISNSSTSEISFYGWDKLPRNVNGLTFHAKISIDDFYPLSVSAPVQNVTF